MARRETRSRGIICSGKGSGNSTVERQEDNEALDCICCRPCELEDSKEEASEEMDVEHADPARGDYGQESTEERGAVDDGGDFLRER